MSVQSVTPIKSYKFFNEPQELAETEYMVVDPCYILGKDDDFWSAYCAHCFPDGGNYGDEGYAPREVWIKVNGKNPLFGGHTVIPHFPVFSEID